MSYYTHPAERPFNYPKAVRGVIDRVYLTLRRAATGRCREVYERFGVEPGVELDVYFALLDHPVPREAVDKMNVYRPFDPAADAARGVVDLVDGHWTLTDTGRELASAVEAAVAATAVERWGWDNTLFATTYLFLPELCGYFARLLEAGQATGGPAFGGFTPIHEAEGARPAAVLASRMGAFRHHRADAHRAAWEPHYRSVFSFVGKNGPLRYRIEDDTDRRDAPVYECLTEDERWKLLAWLGALP